jgi:mRNA interferase MazF
MRRGEIWLYNANPTMGDELTKTSAADTFQVRSVSQQRLIRQLGRIDAMTMRSITQALAIVLKID